MKKFIFFAVAVMVAGAAFATETGTDSAANAAYGDGWATGDDGSDSGDAFGQWDLIAGGSADSYIGSVGGLTGDAFGLWSADPGGNSTAVRPFESGMEMGQTFSFVFGHSYVGTSGNVGFELRNDDGDRISWRFTGGQSFWQMDDGGGFIDIGQGGQANTELAFSFTYEGGNDFSYALGGASGDHYTGPIGQISHIFFHSSSQGAGENFGFNNLRMSPVPEPATMGLLGMGALALGLRRKMRK